MNPNRAKELGHWFNVNKGLGLVPKNQKIRF